MFSPHVGLGPLGLNSFSFVIVLPEESTDVVLVFDDDFFSEHEKMVTAIIEKAIAVLLKKVTFDKI